MIEGWGFNPPPYWPRPPEDWMPPTGWLPDPAWGPVPPGWQLWVPARQVRRRRVLLPMAGLAAVLAVGLLATMLPRADGPAPDDPRTGGVSIISARLPALIPPPGPASPQPGASPRSAASPSPSPAVTVVPHRVAVVRTYRSCAELNRVYRNGVGMPRAVDRTARRRPITNFGRSTTIYRANRKFDRDGDGIACEPR